jgi:SAM-dependent methyltransferase
VDPDVAAAGERLLDTLAGHLQATVVDLGLRLGLLKAFRAPRSTAAVAELLGGPDAQLVADWAEAAFAGGWLERAADGYRVARGVEAVLLGGDWAADLSGVTDAVLALGRAREPTGSAGDRNPPPHAAAEGLARAFARRALEVAVEARPGARRILEVASGGGRGLLLLHHYFPTARLFGVEPAAAARAEAIPRLAAAGITRRVTLLDQPLDQFALVDAAHLAVANLAWRRLRDPSAALRAIRRSLVAGGTLVISEFARPEGDGELATPAGRLLSAWRLLDPAARSPGRGELHAAVRAAGFTVASSVQPNQLQQVLVARA